MCIVLVFFFRYLRNRGDLQWLGLGIIDEEEEERRERERERAMRLRILGLVGEVMGYDREDLKEVTPSVKPKLEEVELKLEGGLTEGRKEEWLVSSTIHPSSASFQPCRRRPDLFAFQSQSRYLYERGITPSVPRFSSASS